MKEEKLQSLYYYFISKRDHITDGGPFLENESFSAVDGGFSRAERFSAADGGFSRAERFSAVDYGFSRPERFSVVDGGFSSPKRWIAQCRESPVNPWMADGNGIHQDDPLVPIFGGNQQPFLYVPQGVIYEPNEISVIGSNLLQIADEFSSTQPTRSVIQFEKHCIVVAPQEQIISISVVRRDQDVDKERKFSWETCDKSAVAGIHYVASSGEVTFEVGETKKNIPIKILTSNDEINDLRFIVKLTDICGVFNPAPLTITLKKVDDFSTDEISVIDNLAEVQPSSAWDVKSILSNCLNQHTFYMGLSFLCSTTDSLDSQFALAFELARVCRPRLQDNVILNALNYFFAQDDIQP